MIFLNGSQQSSSRMDSLSTKLQAEKMNVAIVLECLYACLAIYPSAYFRTEVHPALFSADRRAGEQEVERPGK